MLVYNTFRNDARVTREAKALVQHGYEVTVLAVADAGPDDGEEDLEGIQVVRIRRDPLHYRVLRAARLLNDVRSRLHQRLGVEQHAKGGSESPGLTRGSGTRRNAVERAVIRTIHKPMLYLDWYWRAYRIASSRRWAVVHAHDLNTMPAAMAIVHATGGRLVLDAHELYDEVSTLSQIERRTWRSLSPWLVRKADAVLTVCESIADELAQRHGVTRPTVLLNVPDADPSSWAPTGALYERAGVPSGEPIVLYQGGLVPYRGLKELVLAAADLRRGTVVLMGSGRLQDELEAEIATRALEDRVRIVPPVPLVDLPRYTADAAVGVIPYQGVGLNNRFSTPNKLFEYIAAGVPVIASDLPELSRFVRGLEVGVICDCATPSAVAGCINDLLDDEPRLRAMKRHAYIAREQFTWGVESQILLDLYARLDAGLAPRSYTDSSPALPPLRRAVSA